MIMQQKKQKQVSENDVLIDEKARIIYLPGYLRIKIKNVREFNISTLQASLNMDIIFTVHYGDLKADKFIPALKKKVVFLFEKCSAFKLCQKKDGTINLQTKISVETQKHEIKFTVRKKILTRMQTDVLFTPFNLTNLILSITVQPISVYPQDQFQKEEQQQMDFDKELVEQQIQDDQSDQDNEKQEIKPISNQELSKRQSKKWTLKFNLMDHPKDQYQKISFPDNFKFGEYNLAMAKTKSFYSNQKVISKQDFDKRQIETCDLKNKTQLTQKQADQTAKFQSFQYAHFKIPMFRSPEDSILNIFLPLILLGVINLGIFFQDSAIDSRIQSITSLMIAFVALIPTIQDEIPSHPKMTIVEMMVYCQTFTSLLVFIHSVHYRNKDRAQFSLQYETYVLQNGLFLTSLLINIVIVLYITIMLVLYHKFWKNDYQRYKRTHINFKKKEWSNSACKTKFQALIELTQKISSTKIKSQEMIQILEQVTESKNV